MFGLVFRVQGVGLDDGVEGDHDVECKAPVGGEHGRHKLADPRHVDNVLEVFHDSSLGEIFSGSDQASSFVKLGSTGLFQVDHDHGGRDGEDEPGDDGGRVAEKVPGAEKEHVDGDGAGPHGDEDLLVVCRLFFERVSCHCEGGEVVGVLVVEMDDLAYLFFLLQLYL